MDLSYDAFQKNSSQPVASTGKDLSYSAFTQASVPQPPKPGIVSRILSGAGGIAKSAYKDIASTIATPADRFAEVVGRTGVLGQNIKTGYDQMADEGQSRSFAGGDVAPQKAFGQGGGKQIVGQALKDASYIAPVGRVESAATSLAGGQVAKGVLAGAAAGAIYGGLGGAGDAFNANKSAAEIGHDTTMGAVTGAAGGAALGLGGAALARVVNKIAGAKTTAAVSEALRAETNLPEETINHLAPVLQHTDDHFDVQNVLQNVPGIAEKSAPIEPIVKPSSSIPEHLQPLAEEAKKYKSADEFINALNHDRGGVGNGVEYSPARRLAETGLNDSSLTDHGFDPNEMVTIYRGVDQANQEVINPGDFIASSKDLAKSYTGNEKVIEMKVPASSVRLASSDGLTASDFKNGFNNAHVEAIYNPSKPLNKEELKDLYTKATKGTEEVATPTGKTSGVAKDINTKAIEQGLAEEYKDVATYEPRTIKDQAQKISDIITKDPEDLGRILRGEKPVPEGVSPSYLVTAADKYATANKDAKLMQDLISSKLSGEGSQHASEMRMLGERDQSSAMQALKEVQAAREEVATKKLKGQTLYKVKRATINDIATEVKKVTPKKEDWASFIKSLEC